MVILEKSPRGYNLKKKSLRKYMTLFILSCYAKISTYSTQWYIEGMYFIYYRCTLVIYFDVSDEGNNLACAALHNFMHIN